ncbi:MAG: flagellar protein FlaG [Halomonas sp.]|uniref:flagellar protein FlaG n=1 Tax=Halomonas sp. TaxID=1486246 RepID=UPI0019E1FAB2|nr:flagellar protein FlaG [Halomonas sp.]MBE0490212.1 flagellar protein FlaG [Halomonas sp.]
MSSPLFDATSVTPISPALQGLTPRQQVERALEIALPAAGSALAQAEGGQVPLSRNELVEPIQRINEVMRNYGVQFELADEQSQVVTRIIDRENGDVIRQIPAEELLRVAERIGETLGRLVNLKA